MSKQEDLWWLEIAPDMVVVRSQMGPEEDRRKGLAKESFSKLTLEQLQDVMNRAAKAFSDPTRPQTRPFPEPKPPQPPPAPLPRRKR